MPRVAIFCFIARAVPLNGNANPKSDFVTSGIKSFRSTVKDLSGETGDVEARMRSELEAFGERLQLTVASQVDSRLTVLERKVVVFAEELDDLIEERIAHFTKWEVQRHKDLKGQVMEIHKELVACKNELTRATRHGCIARYFEALNINDEEEKVQMTAMYLMDKAVFWWKRRYTDGCDVKMWEKFKHELKRQFYPESVKDMEMINLQWLRKNRSILEYVKEYSALMLEIPEMSMRQ
ncbi:hypothetical protein RJ639_010676 [Escallonia herrerae]|uniref:Retrotransposon gag domain-containing protein n=1 Tax=Escallonia herrerae TaxID=1293975 RepID=A0AA88VPF6_9ASTE|nr:hypothetical protein RJ639_010676 [Escallonia herrerae]